MGVQTSDPYSKASFFKFWLYSLLHGNCSKTLADMFACWPGGNVQESPLRLRSQMPLTNSTQGKRCDDIFTSTDYPLCAHLFNNSCSALSLLTVFLCICTLQQTSTCHSSKMVTWLIKTHLLSNILQWCSGLVLELLRTGI